MKKHFLKSLIVVYLLYFSPTVISAQYTSWNNKYYITLNSQQKPLINDERLKYIDGIQTDSWIFLKSDSSIRMKKVFLYSDDPEYNKRYPVIVPLLHILGTNILTWGVDHFIFNASYSDISLSTWRSNIKNGWEWDNDRFAMNFILHPLSGSSFYNSGRTHGYSYYESSLYSIAGSLMWEYFGENTSPSIDDLINTTGNSMFLGEAMYRISSNILDDRTSGSERVFREIFAGLVDPSRGISRLLQGKSFRVLSKEVYEKAPLNLTIYGGEHFVNNGTQFMTGTGSQIIGLNLDYGDPFVDRPWKPFDIFKFNLEFSNGEGRKWLNIISGYGLIDGKTLHLGKMVILAGAYQYYNFYDNRLFELYSLGFGGGVMTKIQLSSKISFYNNYHLAIVPLGGNSTSVGPQMIQVRDYNYSGGMETLLESRLDINNAINISFKGYYNWLHTYVGTPGDNYIGFIKPAISCRVYKNLKIGFEHFLYLSDWYQRSEGRIALRNTEQRISLSYSFGSYVR